MPMQSTPFYKTIYFNQNQSISGCSRAHNRPDHRAYYVVPKVGLEPTTYRV